MKLDRLVAVSEAVRATSKRSEKIARLSELIAELDPKEAEIAVAWLAGDLPQGRVGVGPAAIRRAFEDLPGSGGGQTLGEVNELLERIAGISGSGSGRERARLLRDLFERSTDRERAFLAGLLMGELRQGAQEGVLLQAVARAAGVPSASVRRAVMLAGQPGPVAKALLREGPAGLDQFKLELFRPLQPMLASSASGVDEALDRLGTALLDQKLDGARIQVHRRGSEIRVFTRRLNEETASLPEIVEIVEALEVEEVVLDGEVLALWPDGRPRPFQETMRRFSRSRDVVAARAQLPLTPFFFDILHLDGRSLLDEPLHARIESLDRIVPPAHRVERRRTSERGEARAFLRDVLRSGHEGLVAKSLEAPYLAGRRGKAWLKVKPAWSLDLVVLAAEWGHGRRRGWLSNLHLGARDEETGDWVMVGKTFKGMTDALLEWQTRRLQSLTVRRTGHIVWVRPELLVEVAIDGVQHSPRYPGGVALRFARVRGYREDKPLREADTIQTLRAIRDGRLTPPD